MRDSIAERWNVVAEDSSLFPPFFFVTSHLNQERFFFRLIVVDFKCVLLPAR